MACRFCNGVRKAINAVIVPIGLPRIPMIVDRPVINASKPQPVKNPAWPTRKE